MQNYKILKRQEANRLLVTWVPYCKISVKLLTDNAQPTAIGYLSNSSDLKSYYLAILAPFPPTKSINPCPIGNEFHNSRRGHIITKVFSLFPSNKKAQKKTLWIHCSIVLYTFFYMAILAPPLGTETLTQL